MKSDACFVVSRKYIIITVATTATIFMMMGLLLLEVCSFTVCLNTVECFRPPALQEAEGLLLNSQMFWFLVFLLI